MRGNIHSGLDADSDLAPYSIVIRLYFFRLKKFVVLERERHPELGGGL